MKHLLSCGLVLLLVACGVPEVATPAPTPEAIFISYPAALQSWANKIKNCASEEPQIAIYFQQPSSSGADLSPNAMILQLGEPSQMADSEYLSQVGNEQIVVIVNQKNDQTRMSADELHSIFSGQTSRWDNNTAQQVKVWVMPDGDPVRVGFDKAVLPSGTLTTHAMLAPDPSAMLEAISGDSSAIGYLPKSFISTSDQALVEKVKIVDLPDSLKSELDLPVIAITQSEPRRLLRNLLVCTQSP